MTGVALVREILFFKNDLRDKKGKLVLMCFLCAAAVCGWITWSSIYSLLAMVASMISVVSFWLGNPRITRILAFPTAGCMLIYGYINGSVAVMINESMIILSSLIGLIRLDRKQQST